MRITATRYHDISCGHTVCGHEGKCIHLHGHNYRIHFTCEAYDESEQLDQIGRVIDFSVIKSKLCMFLEETLDHKFLVWSGDPRAESLRDLDSTVVITSFNPTAENIATWLGQVVAPAQLYDTGVQCVEVVVEETAKCLATWSLK